MIKPLPPETLLFITAMMSINATISLQNQGYHIIVQLPNSRVVDIWPTTRRYRLRPAGVRSHEKGTLVGDPQILFNIVTDAFGYCRLDLNQIEEPLDRETNEIQLSMF
jgi:hypothetical protein